MHVGEDGVVGIGVPWGGVGVVGGGKSGEFVRTDANVVCVEENVMEEVGEVVGGRVMLSKRRGKSASREGVAG